MKGSKKHDGRGVRPSQYDDNDVDTDNDNGDGVMSVTGEPELRSHGRTD